MIAGVLLAAGRSGRMGQPKPLLPWHGRPLVRHVTQTALEAPLAELVVVVGYEAERVRSALQDLPLRVVMNDAWAAGQSTSLAAGIGSLGSHVSAALVLLADQPLLQTDTIAAIMDMYKATAAPIVVPRFNGQRGNPVLWSRALFAELQARTGDQGGRSLLQRYAADVHWLDVADEGVLLDVDTPATYRELLERTGTRF